MDYALQPVCLYGNAKSLQINVLYGLRNVYNTEIKRTAPSQSGPFTTTSKKRGIKLRKYMETYAFM